LNYEVQNNPYEIDEEDEFQQSPIKMRDYGSYPSSPDLP
jgi:hypothetical protein